MKLATFSLSVLLICSFGALGCGDDDGTTDTTPGPDAVDDTVTDTPQQEVTPDIPIEDETPDCKRCRNNADCDPDEWCSSGCCIPRAIEEACSSHGQACEGDSWSNNNYYCDNSIRICLARCDSDDMMDCPTGALCFGLRTPPPDLPDGVCLDGDCNDSCFAVGGDCTADDLWVCDCNESYGIFDCEPGPGTCHPLGNGASFCASAGSQEEGDPCEVSDECEAGLFCYFDECVEPCNSRTDAGCEDPDECIAVWGTSGPNAPGVCGQECGFLSLGDCEEGYRCEVAISGFTGEITGNICVAYLTDDDGVMIPLAVPNGPCDADPSDGLDNQCPEGYICGINFDTDTVGTCTQWCNPTMVGTEDLAHCPSIPGVLLFADGYVDFEEIHGYDVVSAIEGAPLLLVDGDLAALATLAEANLPAGTASTIIVHHDDDGDPTALTFLDYDAETATLDGEAGVRLYNIGSEDVTVGLVVPLLELDQEVTSEIHSLSYGAGFDNFFLVLESVWWQYFFHLPAADRPSADFAEVVVMGLLDPAEGEEASAAQMVWFDADLPADFALTGTAIRVINASLEYPSIDLSIDTYGSDDIVYGTASDWIVLTVEHTSIDFTASISYDDAVDALPVSLTARAKGDVDTIIFFDGDAGPETMVLVGVGAPAVDHDLAIRVTVLVDLPADESLVLAWEDLEVLGEVTSGAVKPELGAIALPPGSYRTTSRWGAVDHTMAPPMYGPWFEFEADSVLVGIFFVHDGEFEGGLGEFFAEPDLSELAAGEALLRLVNLGVDAPVTLSTLPGAGQVCMPLSVDGLGRCMDACVPYMPGVPYQDEDKNSTGRWMDSGCPHTESISFACIAFVTNDNNDVQIDLEGYPDLHGACTPRDATQATGAFGSVCTTTRDAGCNPDGFCVGVTQSRAECLKLCRPYSGAVGGDCDNEAGFYCYNNIYQAYGFCMEPELSERREGDTCTAAQAIFQCASDDTICLGFQGSAGTDYRCRRLCKSGLGNPDGSNNPTCPPLDGVPRICREDVGFGGGLPAWLSVCDFAE